MTLDGDVLIAPGATVEVRDEEWLVRAVSQTLSDGLRVDVRGTSELVRDQSATFFTALDTITVLDPTATRLVVDDSAEYRRSRLWLEAVLREAPVPMTDTRIFAGHRALLDQMPFQLRPAHLALTNPHPRLLIADAVGLGKTLEIGIILADLIRRGRGERILVVTPRAVLEQFQHEMWTKFAIPLVRLDSDGIQKVRQTLPASRNPFSYYRRVIVSIDTLKNPVRYRHHLTSQRWDVVVIDECHNLINRGTQNHQLASLLAQQTDALILSSATPHNGQSESFAELIDLLDPTAIKDKSAYTADDIASLYVRRHRNSPDVKHEVGDRWAARLEPSILNVPASPAEEGVLAELNATWLRPPPGSTLVDKRRRLFPWTLFKSFLSSPAALKQTITNRLATIAGEPGAPAEASALETLRDLNDAAALAPAKLTALLEHLAAIDVGPGRPTRVVIFSERIATLTWLERELRKRLKLAAGEVRLLHAQLPDASVQEIVETFGLASAKVRILLASDMASEGLNLHLQCHHLVHYDLPWSFIRIQQRNGRIDRYLQETSPQITALALTSDDTDVASDLRVVTTLLRKEHAANQALGDAAVLLRLHDEDLEEQKVMDALLAGRDLDEELPDPDDLDPFGFESLFATGGEHESEPPPAVADAPTLFHDDDNFLYEALTDLHPGGRGLALARDAGQDLLAFDTPDDLRRLLRDLPADYLRDQQVAQRIRLTGSRDLALARLAKAKEGDTTRWPDVHFLAPTHPVLSWVSSRLLARLGRNEAPVMAADVSEPIFLTQALWSNRRGQAALAHWGAVTGLTSGRPTVTDLIPAITAAGITEQAVNPGTVADEEALQALVPAAVAAAIEDLRARRADLEGPLLARVAQEQARVAAWTAYTLDAAAQSAPSMRKRTQDAAHATSARAGDYLQSLLPAGEPFVRVVGVIAPARKGAE